MYSYIFYSSWCDYKWDCFLNVSFWLFLVYTNAKDFYILILYPGTLLNSLMISGSFLVASLGFSMYSIMSSVNRGNFISSFQFGFLLFLFLVWFLWLGFPILCWIKIVRVGILVLLLILEEMLSAFHSWVWC